jgi:hypothetical protein
MITMIKLQKLTFKIKHRHKMVGIMKKIKMRENYKLKLSKNKTKIHLHKIFLKLRLKTN